LEGGDKGKDQDGEKYSANQVAVEFIDWHALEGLDSSVVGRWWKSCHPTCYYDC